MTSVTFQCFGLMATETTRACGTWHKSERKKRRKAKHTLICQQREGKITIRLLFGLFGTMSCVVNYLN